MDRQLPDGSIQRTDPQTGRTRIISEADYQRTRLTRERDAEFAMQAGAPPIAQGPVRRMPDMQPVSTGQAGDPDRYRGNNREENVRRAKADGQFESKRAAYNAANRETQMDATGTIYRVSGGAPGAPAMPAAEPTLAPSDPSNLDSPLVPSAPRAPSAPSAPRAATTPNLPASYDQPMRNVAVAAGPNISINDPRKPNPFPQGSIAMKRADGSFTVELPGGETRSFASEQDAAKAFSTPPPVPPPTPEPAIRPPATLRADASPDAASQAWAQNAAGRARGGATMPDVAPDRGQAGLARNGPPFVTDPSQLAAPVAPPPPVVDQTPKPAATPTNGSAPAPVAAPSNAHQASSDLVKSVVASPVRAVEALGRRQDRVLTGRKEKDRAFAASGGMRDMGRPATLPGQLAAPQDREMRRSARAAGRAEMPNLDASSVPMSVGDPIDFPSIRPTGRSNARTSLA
jgi:hypothetical protein